jgi:molybdopterin/thiamine biosynthesis adenylyltransferase
MSFYSLTLRKDHFVTLKAHLLRADRRERAAYVLCNIARIGADPWERQAHFKFLSCEVIPVPDEELIESTQDRVTWPTNSFVAVLKKAQLGGKVVAVVHNHGDGLTTFSGVDDGNEPELSRLAGNRNGVGTKILSLVITPEEEITGRVWLSPQAKEPLHLVRIFGSEFSLRFPGRGQGMTSPALHRQMLAFGTALNQDLRMLRIGIVGCGGTGSAVAMLLARLGVGQLVLFDNDIVDTTNLNRLHGARQADADALRPKVDVIAREITGLGLGVRAVPMRKWVGDSVCRDALKSCDIVFGCTDDNQGRILLNRFAYYYLVPVIDMGLAIEVTKTEPPQIQALDGRVTVLFPNHPCLLCREIVSGSNAHDEGLRRSDPAEYERRKAEAYVFGEGNPDPAVVTFTTEVATMAINEMIHRLQGFRGPEGAKAQLTRFFHRMEDKRPGAVPSPTCPVCAMTGVWGLGDVEPFLDMVT